MQQISELITQEISHQEQVQTVSKPSKIGDNLQLALTDKRICHLEDTEPLFQALRFAMLLVGLRAKNLPDEQEKAVLVMHIRKNYSGHTCEEIKLAFEMAISGKLDLEQSQVVCYENFSCQYFSGIMNAYRKWAAEQVKQSYHPVEQVIYSDADLDNFKRMWTEEFYQRIRNGQVENVPEYTKEILVKDGLVKQGESVSNFFVQKLNKMAENIYRKVE